MRWGQQWKRFRRNESGASMVEFSIVAFFMFLLLGGLLDFGLLYYQLNTATKALYQGARIASVSCPVSDALAAKTSVTGSLVPGDPTPYYKITCSGASSSCTEGAFRQSAFNLLLNGRANLLGMQSMFSRIQQANITITYEHTGLGFVGRPGGPVPTITIELVNMTYGFIFIRGLTALTTFTFPTLKTTATGEDLNNNGTDPTTGSIIACS